MGLKPFRGKALEPKEVLDNIKTKISRNKHKPDIDEFYAEVGRDPVKLLGAFLAMRNHPYRHQLGFQRKDLEWITQMWYEAASATERGRERDEMLRFGEHYRGLQQELERGELERREEGIMFLEDKDWPHPIVIMKAMESLCEAGVKVLQ